MAENKNIHAGHRARLKRKFLNSNSEDFEPHEALEILLFYALPQKNTNIIAHELLQRFGSLSGVLEADVADLIKVDGIKEHTATLIKLQTAMFRMYLKDKYSVKNIKITPDNAGEYAKSLFYGYKDEVLFAIMLDAEFRLITAKKLAEGTNNSSHLYSRVFLSKALESNAAYIILAHNHPNGILVPSVEDVKVTKMVERGLTFINVHLIDHIIVAGNDYVCIKREFGKIYDEVEPDEFSD